MENIKVQEYRNRGTNIECVSSAAQWNFLSIQQVHMRGISFFRCHGGMTFRNMEVLTMENIKVVYNTRTYSNDAITAANVAQIYITTCNFSNCNGGVFNVRNSSMEMLGSFFHNNYALYRGVLYVHDSYLRGTHQNRITLTNSTFTNKRASGYGGAIYIHHSLDSFSYGRWYYYYSVVLSISNSSFNNNRASHYGGAVYYSGDEDMNITHSIFTNSYASRYHGGAIYSTSSVRIAHCNITGNTASQQGGAIYSSSNVIISNCTVSDNAGTTVGGAINSLSSVTAENCNISSNRGGAIYSSSHVIISNCTVSDNTGATVGGVIYSSSSVTVTNSYISGNTANHQGGAIYSSQSVTISHATLSNNRAGTQGGAIYSRSQLACECCIFINNLAADGGAVFVNDTLL